MRNLIVGTPRKMVMLNPEMLQNVVVKNVGLSVINVHMILKKKSTTLIMEDGVHIVVFHVKNFAMMKIVNIVSIILL